MDAMSSPEKKVTKAKTRTSKKSVAPELPFSENEVHSNNVVSSAERLTHTQSLAEQLTQELKDHKAEEASLLDVHESAGWTDFFIIVTATSTVHLTSLCDHSLVWADKKKITVLNRASVRSRENPWIVIDLGDIVVHLMTSETRGFYDLEKLWFKTPSEK